MKAVITVVGKDTIGIVAKVSSICADYEVNIIDVTQTILEDLFTMIMLVDLEKMKTKFETLKEKLVEEGRKSNLQIHVMHEDIFNAMHQI